MPSERDESHARARDDDDDDDDGDDDEDDDDDVRVLRVGVASPRVARVARTRGRPARRREFSTTTTTVSAREDARVRRR